MRENKQYYFLLFLLLRDKIPQINFSANKLVRNLHISQGILQHVHPPSANNGCHPLKASAGPRPNLCVLHCCCLTRRCRNEPSNSFNVREQSKREEWNSLVTNTSLPQLSWPYKGTPESGALKKYERYFPLVPFMILVIQPKRIFENKKIFILFFGHDQFLPMTIVAGPDRRSTNSRKNDELIALWCASIIWSRRLMLRYCIQVDVPTEIDQSYGITYQELSLVANSSDTG